MQTSWLAVIVVASAAYLLGAYQSIEWVVNETLKKVYWDNPTLTQQKTSALDYVAVANAIRSVDNNDNYLSKELHEQLQNREVAQRYADELLNIFPLHAHNTYFTSWPYRPDKALGFEWGQPLTVDRMAATYYLAKRTMTGTGWKTLLNNVLFNQLCWCHQYRRNCIPESLIQDECRRNATLPTFDDYLDGLKAGHVTHWPGDGHAVYPVKDGMGAMYGVPGQKGADGV